MPRHTHPCILGAAFALSMSALALPSTGRADDEPAHLPHHHGQEAAPIGVMGAHAHGADHWMVSYRYMYMRMEGNLDGDSRLSPQDVRDAGYPVVPTDMDMHMHMFGAMYAPIDELTIALMLPVVHMSMHHQAGMPLGAMQFTTRSAGIGDMRLSGLVRLFADPSHQLLLGVGLVLPSGSTHVRGDTPMAEQVRLPYPMRPGGGSVAGYPSLTYTGRADIVSWGVQASAILPMHSNEDSYRLGFEYQGTVWAALQIMPWFGASLRFAGLGRENIEGADPDLNPMMVATADPRRRALVRMEALLGVTFTAPGTDLEGHRLSIEVGVPYYQHVAGPQLASVVSFVAGWQWTPE